MHFALSLKTRSPSLLRDTRQSNPPCQVKQAKHVLDSCSVPLLPFATTANICSQDAERDTHGHAPRTGHLSPQCHSRHHPTRGYAPALHRSQPKARSPTRRGDGQLTQSLQAAGLHSELTLSKGELRLAWTAHQDYLKTGSFPVPSQLSYRSFQSTPRRLRLLPAPWQAALADKAEARPGSAAQKPRLPQQQPKQAPQPQAPAAGTGGTAASAQHGPQNTTPQTAAMRPCGTHSNHLQGEAAWEQSSDVPAVSVRRMKKPRVEHLRVLSAPLSSALLSRGLRFVRC